MLVNERNKELDQEGVADSSLISLEQEFKGKTFHWTSYAKWAGNLTYQVNNIYEVNEEGRKEPYDFLHINFEDDDVILDIGANVGTTSIFLAKFFPKIKIYSFEPVKSIFEILIKNLEKNEITNVTPINKALNQDGRDMTFTFPFDHPGAATQDMNVARESLIYQAFQKQALIIEEAEGLILDDFIKEQQITKIKLLKIDCEGGEYEILKNLSDEVWESIEYFVMETHGSDQDQWEMVYFVQSKLKEGAWLAAEIQLAKGNVLLNWKRKVAPKVSIIIPVYDVEKYLRKCLDSVVNQTERDLEIIIVNDCSPDNSEEIILEYAKNDSRIKYIKHKVNKHVGGARNTGLANATGEYIWFLDSDDWVDINAVEILYNTAKRYDVELLTTNLLGYEPDNTIKTDVDYGFLGQLPCVNKKMTGKELYVEKIKHNVYTSSVWTYFLKRELANKSSFFEHTIHQDEDWSVLIYLNAASALHIKYAPYYYLMVRKDSILYNARKDEKLVTIYRLKLLNRLLLLIKSNDEYKHLILLRVNNIFSFCREFLIKLQSNSLAFNQEIAEEYELLLKLYKDFTQKDLNINDLNKVEPVKTESILPSLSQQIKKLRKEYWQRKRKVWTRDWLRFRDRYILWRG